MQVGQVVVDRARRGAGTLVAGSAGLGDLAAPGLGAVEELAGAGQRRRATGVAAEHLGQLDDPALAVELLDLGHGPAVALALGDPVVGVGVGGDLGQVRDAQDLVASGEGPQAAPDRVRAAPADPRVDLVEDEDGRLVGLGQDALDRQRDARQLAARRDPRERPGRLARVRGEAVDDLVGAARVERDGVAIELDRGLVRRRPRRRPSATSKTPAGKPSSSSTSPTAVGERVAGRPSRLRQGAGRRRDRGRAAPRPRARAGRAPRRGRASRSSSAAARSPWAMTSASSSP